MPLTDRGSTPFWQLAHLTDDEVVAGLGSLAQTCRRATARLLAHLAEVEERRLALRSACSSLFVYCTTRLGMSEDEACRRIEAARLARRFPRAYELLDAGRLHLTGLCLLKGRIDEDNCEELLAGVSGKSVRQAQEWLAARFPRPDVPSLIRKLPEARSPEHRSSGSEPVSPPHPPPAGSLSPPTGALPAPAEPPAALVEEAGAPTSAPPIAAGPIERPAPRGRIDPLSDARYRVQLTASRELKEKLELARDLMSHAHPGADLAIIVERAVDLLVAELTRKRFGATARPKRGEQPGGAPRDQATSAAKRAVLERDGIGCTYVDDQGHRCGERAFLQRDHVRPRARGGASTPENLRHLCAAHNQLMAELEYGRRHVERAIQERRDRERLGRGPAG